MTLTSTPRYILVLVLYTVTLELFDTTMGDGHMMMMGEQSHSSTVDWVVDLSYLVEIRAPQEAGWRPCPNP
jgi:hypothetical protein